jgi:hypothetical protein
VQSQCCAESSDLQVSRDSAESRVGTMVQDPVDTRMCCATGQRGHETGMTGMQRVRALACRRPDRRRVGCMLVIATVDASHRDTAECRQRGDSEREAEHEAEPVPHLDDPHGATV